MSNMDPNRSKIIDGGVIKKKKKSKSIDKVKTMSDSENTEHIEKSKESVTWPKDVLMNLLNRVSGTIPSEDKLAHKTRLSKLSWSEVSFDGHTESECKEVFNSIYKNVRKYRLLNEVIEDMRIWLKDDKSGVRKEKLKRPLNAFLLYMKDIPSVRKKNSNLSISEYIKFAHNLYTKLSEDERQKYVDLARMNFEDYQRKMMIYELKNPSDKPGKKKRKTIRSKTAFGEYLEQHLSESPLTDEKLAELTSHWNELSEDDRLTWFKIAATKNQEFKNRSRSGRRENTNKNPTKIATVKKSAKIVPSQDVSAIKMEIPTEDAITYNDEQLSADVEDESKNKKKKQKKRKSEPEQENIEQNNFGHEVQEVGTNIKKKKKNMTENVPAEVLSVEKENGKKNKKNKTPTQDEVDNSSHQVELESPKKKKKKKKSHNNDNEREDLNISASVEEENHKIKKKKKKNNINEDEVQNSSFRTEEEVPKIKKKKKKDKDAEADESKLELESPGKSKKKKKKHSHD